MGELSYLTAASKGGKNSTALVASYTALKF